MATRTTFQEVISEFRNAASNSEAGTRFEQLMVDYFSTDPTLSVVYDVVEPWSRWAHNEHSHDVGIDLVARNRALGTWTAVQCKFYDSAHYLQKKDIDSFFTASGRTWDGVGFDNRIIVSTTDRWSSNAEKALENQVIPVQRIGLTDISQSPIDWMRTSNVVLDFEPRKAVRYGLRPHQKEAIDKIQAGFAEHDRGQWISACGTGKTFTSLKLAEQRCADNGGQLKVLFLAPSISLVAQTLREWMAQSQTLIRPLVVCSDSKASKQAEDISTRDIPLPTTSPEKLAELMSGIGRRGKQMTVVFSTYQSIDAVAAAQKASDQQFDLILCDEAHRTTGVTLSGDNESAFVKVHDNSYLPATKRLYMTATPRIYGDDAKAKAQDASALLTSMDDESVYGPVFHAFGFGEAVEKGLLSDYKVMILCVTNESVAAGVQAAGGDAGNELTLDDAAKIVGCWNGLAKRTADMDFGRDPVPMKRAVAFAQSIKASRQFAATFPGVVEQVMGDDSARELTVSAHHVDGTMNALVRGEELAWLKAPVADNECRILANARCLSEGVDVPALDAVLFLSPRNSLVDVVQSVGRVMRKAPGKEFGYIILPVAIGAGQAPEEAMRNNKRFKVVWDVLNALRSHDDRFNAMINSIDLDKSTKGKVSIEVFPHSDGSGGTADNRTDRGGVQVPLFGLDRWRDAILARIVKKVGDRDYWDSWADDVVSIHANQVARINTILARGDARLRARFEDFLAGLRANINEAITPDQAIDMVSQHLITAPIFSALFTSGDFASSNPVSVSMDAMVAALDGHGLDAERAQLTAFYESVSRTVASVETTAGRQTIIHRLYEEFFSKAFKKQSQSLGVVYTPVEVVDFILRMADQVSARCLGQSLSDEGVHVLDPFTGTGTFIVRLLESGIIRPADLERKFTQELWANEIMLLAYYIACVNIETTYQSLRAHGDPQGAPYCWFPGATFTDTFQITEDSDRVDTSLIPANSDRISAQLATPIQVIVGNPPYSVGQDSANDDNQNLRYPTLDARITDTYAALSSATNKNSLYDSYIRALRWASDRIAERGVVAFVSNNGWVDGNTADGIRRSMAQEFSDIWVYNLRGNARTAGEQRKQEGGGVFDSGARTGVAVLVAVKDPSADTDQARIHYFGVDDYLTREQKLEALTTANLSTVPWHTITPNEAGDWVTQRSDVFQTFAPLAAKDTTDTGVVTFHSTSRGVETTRDAWCYNFSRDAVASNMARMIDFYNTQAASAPTSESELDMDPTRIKWSSSLIPRALRHERHVFQESNLRMGTYRPFCKQQVYFDAVFCHRPGQNAAYFPTAQHENVGFYVVGAGSDKPFAALATDQPPDLAVWGSSSGQFFPRWTYTPAEEDSLLPSAEVDEWGYVRHDNITDGIAATYRQHFGRAVTKDDIFAYVYAVLHSPQYRATFAGDLKRMLPRIPMCRPADFAAFAEAGRRLLALHIGYEDVEPYPLHEQLPLHVGDDDVYRVEKMKWADKTTRRELVYNTHITLSDVPAAAHEYLLGSRSALDWLIDRYQVKTDKASGIVNDPNDWGREHGDPRYIIDLVKKITRVSVDTVTIMRDLPDLGLEEMCWNPTPRR